MANESKALRTKVFDAVIISGISAIVVAIVTGATAFIWSKVVSIDSAIDEALSGVKATQVVAAEEITKLGKQIADLQNTVGILTEALRAADGEAMAYLPEAQSAQQQQQQQQQMQQMPSDIINRIEEVRKK